MRRIEKIIDWGIPELRPYLTLRASSEARKMGIMVVQGEKNTRRLLASRFEVRSLLGTQEWVCALEPWWGPRGQRIQVFCAERRELRAQLGYRMYQDVMAVGILPEAPRLEEVLMTSRRPATLVALDGIANAENLGVIARAAGALGADGLLVDVNSCSPFLRRASRCAMGALFELPVLENRTLVCDLPYLRGHGYTVVGAYLGDESQRIDSVDLSGDCVLVFGAEGDGLRPEVVACCDALASIPMMRGMDSLNVASAATVFFYETARQRGFAVESPR